MSNILVINAGSTSLKYVLFDGERQKQSSGTIREIGTLVQSHDVAWQMMLDELNGAADLMAVGHRIVHGGEEFFEPLIVNEIIIRRLERYNELAPLHNPPGLACLRASLKNLGQNIPNVAVFDTGWFADLPEVVRHYALPAALTKKYHLRRFGFHGISHQSVAEQAAQVLGQDLKKLNLITIHLGGGASMAAIQRGRPIDTSMGFTPMEGLVMMTRCGDIDPAIPLYLQQQGRMTANQVYRLLNHESGMTALSGIADGMLKIEAAAKAGDKRAAAALDFYAYRIKKYLGAYWAILNQVDALVFTGAIGEGSEYIRSLVLKDLALAQGVRVLHFSPEEESLIAWETLKLVKQ